MIAVASDYHQFVSDKKQTLALMRGEERAILYQIESTKKVVDSMTQQVNDMQSVIILLQKASEVARHQMKLSIDSIVTKALQVVFGSEIVFELELSTRAGMPTAEFFVIENGIRLPILDAKGGGLVDVISVAIRLAIIELYNPKITGAILLDEPGKMVSAEYAENFVYFLKEYCHQVGRQFIIVTHNAALAQAGDRTFHVSLVNGESKVIVT